LAQIFFFDCLVVLCYILRIMCPNLHRGRAETLLFIEESETEKAQYIDTLSLFNAVFLKLIYSITPFSLSKPRFRPPSLIKQT